MLIWYLISLMLTFDGHAVADIPTPFSSESACNLAGYARGHEIASSKDLQHGVWECVAVDFAQSDPIPDSAPDAAAPEPSPPPPEPIVPKQEG
jgi:hypothetical protein